MGDYHIEDIYQGGYSTLNPDSGFTTKYRLGTGEYNGRQMNEGHLGMATDPRTANILNEVSTKLQTGAKQIEVSTVRPDVFESIPTQQLKEVKRLSELTGIDISVHAPLIEPSGISRQGGFSELSRQQAERQMLSAVLRSAEMSPKGNIPVTFHSSQDWPGPEYQLLKDPKTGRLVEEKAKIPIINQESGQIGMVQAEQRYTLGVDEKKLRDGERYSAERQIEIRNHSEWDDSLTNLIAVKDRADRMIRETAPVYNQIKKKLESEGVPPTRGDQEIMYRYRNAGVELDEIQRHLKNIFEKAWKYGEGGEIRTERGPSIMLKEEHKMALNNISNGFRESIRKVDPDDLPAQSMLMDSLMAEMRNLPAPNVYKPIEDFALDKSATSFANVALGSYKKLGSNAPVISIENPPVGGGLSRGEDLKNLVEATRKKFVDQAVQEKVMSRGEAEKQADKLIGVTWDVGHINMMRKYGFTEEDVVKEAGKVAPFVKHVHLSDNFGFEHTELPMGMGNVPIKDIMEKLGQKGFEATKVIEAGNWWEHFKSAPFQETLEAFGSPIYAMKMQPYWNQAVRSQGYFSGYGQMLPQGNYDTFGSGFSNLPSELGGQRQSTGRSRMSGSPME